MCSINLVHTSHTLFQLCPTDFLVIVSLRRYNIHVLKINKITYISTLPATLIEKIELPFKSVKSRTLINILMWEVTSKVKVRISQVKWSFLKLSTKVSVFKRRYEYLILQDFVLSQLDVFIEIKSSWSTVTCY